ncbi:hypothetical protein [Tannerella forsythia]|uniref:hypothetical protein n=1 Tax=Tannerella forsythia TaxID=28112 RepID=UPI0028E19F45|nr:hypothetical protein [Tannerella forsythia]
MLNNTFYTIRKRTDTEGGVDYRVSLNVSHVIYEAHFPGNPVTPGVCIIQMIKELVEAYRDTTFLLRTIKNVKFMKVIDPRIVGELTFALNVTTQDDGMTIVSGIVGKGDTIFSKINLIFEEVK